MKNLRFFYWAPLGWLTSAAFGAEKAAVAAATATAAPTSSAGSLIQVLFGLTVVLGLMAAAAWALKRFGGSRAMGGGAIKIIGGISVGSRERVLLIEAAGQWIVVGVAPGCVNALATLPRQETTALSDPALPVVPASNFAYWLNQIREKRDGR